MLELITTSALIDKIRCHFLKVDGVLYLVVSINHEHFLKQIYKEIYEDNAKTTALRGHICNEMKYIFNF